MRASIFNSFPYVLFVVGLLSAGTTAQDHQSEQGQAAIQDPQQQCTAYSYQPVLDAISQFPPIWQPATIVKGDTEAQSLWDRISPNIPQIAPKGTLDGNFSSVVSYPSSDPDCWWSQTQCTTPKLAGLPPDIAGIPEPMTMGYGFDDGPNCSHNAFYDFLSEQNQKATMFYIGSNVMNWPLQAQRALADGHELCVHSWSHRYMTGFQSQDAFAELYYTIKAIKLVTGVTSTCWRPPFGALDDRIRAIAKALGLQTIMWQHDSFDWKVKAGLATPDDVNNNYQGFVQLAQNGSLRTGGTITLTHELNNYTMSTAMDWYPRLKAAYKYIVPVGVALNKTQPYVETDHSLPNFEKYTSGQGQQSSGTSNTNSTSSHKSNNSTGTTSSTKTNGAGTVSPAIFTLVSVFFAIATFHC